MELNYTSSLELWDVTTGLVEKPLAWTIDAKKEGKVTMGILARFHRLDP